MILIFKIFLFRKFLKEEKFYRKKNLKGKHRDTNVQIKVLLELPIEI